MKQEKQIPYEKFIRELQVFMEEKPAPSRNQVFHWLHKTGRRLWKNISHHAPPSSAEDHVEEWVEQCRNEIERIERDWKYFLDKQAKLKRLSEIANDNLNIWSHSAEIFAICRNLYLVKIDVTNIKQDIGALEDDLRKAQNALRECGVNNNDKKKLVKKWLDRIDMQIRSLSELSRRLKIEEGDRLLPETLQALMAKIQERCRADPFAAIQSVSTYSGAQIVSILIAAAASAGAAFSIPYYSHFGIEVWRFWVLEDYFDYGLFLVLAFLLLISGLGLLLKKSLSRLTEAVLRQDKRNEPALYDPEAEENCTGDDEGSGVRSERKLKWLCGISATLRVTAFIVTAAIIVFFWPDSDSQAPERIRVASVTIALLLLIVVVSAVQIGTAHLYQRRQFFFRLFCAPPLPNSLLMLSFFTFLAALALGGWAYAPHLEDWNVEDNNPQIALFNNQSEICNVKLLGLTSRTAFLVQDEHESCRTEEMNGDSNSDLTTTEDYPKTFVVDRAQILCLDKRSACEEMRPPERGEAPSEGSINLILHEDGRPEGQPSLTSERLEILFECANGERVEEIQTAYFSSGKSFEYSNSPESAEFSGPCQEPFGESGNSVCGHDNRWSAPNFVNGAGRSQRSYLVLGATSSAGGINNNLQLAKERAEGVREELIDAGWSRLRTEAVGELLFGGSMSPDPNETHRVLDDDPKARKVEVYGCEAAEN